MMYQRPHKKEIQQEMEIMVRRKLLQLERTGKVGCQRALSIFMD